MSGGYILLLRLKTLIIRCLTFIFEQIGGLNLAACLHLPALKGIKLLVVIGGLNLAVCEAPASVKREIKRSFKLLYSILTPQTSTSSTCSYSPRHSSKVLSSICRWISMSLSLISIRIFWKFLAKKRRFLSPPNWST